MSAHLHLTPIHLGFWKHAYVSRFHFGGVETMLCNVMWVTWPWKCLWLVLAHSLKTDMSDAPYSQQQPAELNPQELFSSFNLLLRKLVENLSQSYFIIIPSHIHLSLQNYQCAIDINKYKVLILLILWHWITFYLFELIWT